MILARDHISGGTPRGIGGYIDHMIFRDKDANTAWTTASDGKLEERRYYCQNWRADVSAMLTSAGKMVEWVKYSSYGRPFSLPVGDTDSDGDWDATDSGNMTGAYEVRKDADLDGAIKAADITHANSITGTYQTLGKGVVTSSSVANRKAYAGYENDGAIARFAHVRNRVMDSTLGRWTRRDLIGYVDGLGLYGYVTSRPIIAVDTFGLASMHGSSRCCTQGRMNSRPLQPHQRGPSTYGAQGGRCEQYPRGSECYNACIGAAGGSGHGTWEDQEGFSPDSFARRCRCGLYVDETTRQLRTTYPDHCVDQVSEDLRNCCVQHTWSTMTPCYNDIMQRLNECRDGPPSIPGIDIQIKCMRATLRLLGKFVACTACLALCADTGGLACAACIFPCCSLLVEINNISRTCWGAGRPIIDGWLMDTLEDICDIGGAF